MVITAKKINQIIITTTTVIKQIKISRVVNVVLKCSKSLKEDMEEEILRLLLIQIQRSTLKWLRITLIRILIITSILEVYFFSILTFLFCLIP